MPAGKQSAITLNFSKKNIDIYNFLAEEKRNKNINQCEFICNAIRFYLENKDKCKSNLDLKHIDILIDKKLEEFKSIFMNGLILDNTTNEEEKKLETLFEEVNPENMEED